MLGVATAGGRRYRAVVVAGGQLEQDAIDQVRATLSESGPWILVPAGSRTVDLRHLAFSCLSRTLCVMHDQREKNRHYPYRTFMVLVDHSMASVIEQEQCEWDDWTRKLFVAYERRGGFLCSDALEDIRTTALSLRVDTAQIEALHASLRRSSVSMGCQTHSFAFPDASADMFLRKVRRQQVWVKERLADILAAGPDEPERQVGDDSAQCDAPGNCPRGGGGPWRAFIAEWTDEHPTGSPDFAYLSTLYEALGDEEMERYRRMGLAGTARHRDGELRPFGARKREVERASRNALMQNVGQAMLDIGDRSSAQAESVTGGLAEALCQTADHDNVSVESAVAVARAHCNVQSKMKTAREKAERDELQRFRDGAGATEKQIFAETFPALASHASCLSAAPSTQSSSGGLVHRFEWHPAEAWRQAAQLVTISGASKLGRCVGHRLDAAWAHLHKTIPPSRSEHLSEKPPKRSACLVAGMCVCHRSGRGHVPRMAAGLRSVYRASLRHRPLAQDVMGARTILLLVGRSPGQELASSEAGPSDGGGVRDEHVVVFWYHLAHLVLKPWRPLLQEMAAPVATTLSIALVGQVVLRGTGQARTCCEALSLLDKSLRWDAVLFRFVQSERLLGSFDPHIVEIEVAQVPGSPVMTPIWDPSKRLVKRKRKCTWDFNISVSDGESNDGANEGAHVSEDPEGNLEEWLSEEIADLAAEEAAEEEVQEAEAAAAEAEMDMDGAIVAVESLPQDALAQEIAMCAAEAQAPLNDAAPLPLPPPERRRRRPVADGNVRVQLDCGTLAFYAGRRQMYAMCSQPNHNMCRMTRTVNGDSRRRIAAKGRPLGFLTAWLQDGHMYASADAHHHECRPSWDDRRSAREFLHGVEGAEQLFAAERERIPDEEASEPEGVP